VQLAAERRDLAPQARDVGARRQVQEMPQRARARLDAPAGAGLDPRGEPQAAEERAAAHGVLQARGQRALGGVERLHTSALPSATAALYPPFVQDRRRPASASIDATPPPRGAHTVPTVQGLEFAYALYALPPGRLPFRRWRWELWHGATLVASGWRPARPDAGRALRTRAAEFGCRLFGLPAPSPPGRADLRPGATERVVIGPITCLLVPRALDRPALVTG
jgi:hypothetical protein